MVLVEQKPAAMQVLIYEHQLQLALSPAQEITHPTGQKHKTKLASSSARVGVWSKCRCSGVSNPIRIPEQRAAGWVWGRPPPTCAGSSRWVPSLEGLGLAKTPRCLPRHVVRVVSAPTRPPTWCGWLARRHVLRGSCWRLNPRKRLAVAPLTCPKVAWLLGAALARPQLVLVWGAWAVEPRVT